MVQSQSLPPGGAARLLAVHRQGREPDPGREGGGVRFREFLKVVSFLSLLSTLSLPALFPFLRISALSPFVTLITPALVWGSNEKRDVVGENAPSETW